MATSPTQLSLKKLREEGYTVAVVEHWNSFARIRQDLFGFIDLLALVVYGFYLLMYKFLIYGKNT